MSFGDSVNQFVCVVLVGTNSSQGEFKGSSRAARQGKNGEDPFGRNTQGKSLLGRLVLGLEKEEKTDFEKRNGFHQPSSPIFLFFLFFFYGCSSPFHELISFSRVLM